MYACETCRTAFCWPQPADDELEAFYHRFHASDEEGGRYDEVEPRMQEDFPAKLDLVKRTTFANPGRILDIGCGKGFFARACLDVGFDIEGIDVSGAAVRYAREQLGIRTHHGTIDAMKNTLGVFDTVTLWATIEHLPRPWETLSAVSTVLRPGGYLFVDTGRGGDWLDRLLPGKVQWYDPPQHLYVFSESGLRMLVEGAGFEIVQFDGCFERSAIRKVTRATRAFAIALALRATSSLTAMSAGHFEFTRYPLGNLMSIVARSTRADTKENGGSIP